MNLKDALNEINNTEFNCVVFGKPNKGKILKLDLETNQVLVKLKDKVTKLERVIEPNMFANREGDYHFEDKEVSVSEVWLNLE